MMIETSKLVLFFVSAIVLLLIPGPAVLYIVARSIDQGRKAGFVSALGLAVGTIFHLTAATLGLSAILLASALAFIAVKYLGAAYLITLGIRKLWSSKENEGPVLGEQKSLKQIFYQGIVVNLLNPKTAIFFFAFLPQFVSPAAGPVPLQIFVFGLLFLLMGVVTDSLYALVSGKAGSWLKSHLGFVRAQRYFAGTVYIGLGLATALSGNSKK